MLSLKSYQPFTMTQPNVLTIYNGGLYPKDYFEYSATIDLNQIVPFKSGS